MTTPEINTAAMSLKVFGVYVRRLRERKGLSQAALVVQMNGNPSLRTIGRWENGTHEPYLSELAPLIEFLGGSLTRAVLLMMSKTVTRDDAMHMADRADADLSPDELVFFSSLSPKQRRLLRQFIEAEQGDT